MSGFVVRPGEGQTIQGPVGGPLRFLARGEQTGGALTAVENVIPPGGGPPLHRHAHEDELWFVIDGELRFRLGDEEQDAPRGSFIFAPRGVAHAFTNVADHDARLLVMFTPAGFEAFFDGLASLPEIDAQTFVTLGKAVGMEVLGPPLAEQSG